MRVALRTKVEDNGREFLPSNEMSAGMQRTYDRTLHRFQAPGTSATMPWIVPKLPARIIINEREFDDSTQMPPELRRFYEQALAHALPVGRAVRIVAETEHSNFIKRTATLTLIAAGCVAAVVYLLFHGYYA